VRVVDLPGPERHAHLELLGSEPKRSDPEGV
jgi:hypothetical protein